MRLEKLHNFLASAILSLAMAARFIESGIAFGRRVLHLSRREHPSVERVMVSSLSQAEVLPSPLIERTEDQLHLYPGKREYDAAWERHIKSEEALSLQRNIDDVRLRLRDFNERIAPEREKLHAIRQERERAQEVFNVSKFGVKKANRRKRRAQHKLRSILGPGLRLETQLQEAEGAMETFHEEWVFAGDDSRALFYAFDHLRSYEEAREDLFARFVERNGGSFRRLGRLLYGFADIMKVDEAKFFAQTLPSSPGPYFDRAEKIWYQRHPEKPPASEGRQPIISRWLVVPGSEPVSAQYTSDIRTILADMEPEQLRQLRMTRLRPGDVLRWAHLTKEELQHAEHIEEEGFFYGWQRVPRAKQWELLFHKEDDGAMLFHLRRLPEGTTW